MLIVCCCYFLLFPRALLQALSLVESKNISACMRASMLPVYMHPCCLGEKKMHQLWHVHLQESKLSIFNPTNNRMKYELQMYEVKIMSVHNEPLVYIFCFV